MKAAEDVIGAVDDRVNDSDMMGGEGGSQVGEPGVGDGNSTKLGKTT
jgi:hypothetical protein